MARKKPPERNYIQQFLEKIANPKNNAVRYPDKPRRVNRFNRHRCAANLTGVSLCTVLAECCILIEYPIAPHMVNRFYSSATRADSGILNGVTPLLLTFRLSKLRKRDIFSIIRYYILQF